MTTALITRDYNGMTFVFREDGYFNMTKAAKHFNKDLSNFMRSPETSEYLEALSVKFTEKELLSIRRGSGLYPTTGTWAHPKLAVFFARWLDVKFAVWCDMMIEDILTKKAEVTIVKPQESAVLRSRSAAVFLPSMC